jgi:hypothetical protein
VVDEADCEIVRTALHAEGVASSCIGELAPLKGAAIIDETGQPVCCFERTRWPGSLKEARTAGEDHLHQSRRSRAARKNTRGRYGRSTTSTVSQLAIPGIAFRPSKRRSGTT